MTLQISKADLPSPNSCQQGSRAGIGRAPLSAGRLSPRSRSPFQVTPRSCRPGKSRAKVIELNVHIANTDAQSWYVHRGFEFVKDKTTGDKTVAPGGIAYVMRKVV